MDAKKIFTRDEALKIVELFEDLLCAYDIKVPSPEDYERDSDDDVGLYGSTYSDLLDNVEDRLIRMLEKHEQDTEVVTDEFSGTVQISHLN